jgi:hypothetical protein
MKDIKTEEIGSNITITLIEHEKKDITFHIMQHKNSTNRTAQLPRKKIISTIVSTTYPHYCIQTIITEKLYVQFIHITVNRSFQILK